MPTDKPRISFALTDELLREIDEFRYENRIKNQTQAIIALINRGFEAMAGTYNEPPKLTTEEEQLIAAYRAAEDTAREIALETLENHPAAKKASRA